MNLLSTFIKLDRINELKESKAKFIGLDLAEAVEPSIEEQYKEYIEEHKQRVTEYAAWLKENLPDLFTDIKVEDFDKLIEEHDASKYSEEEFLPYAQKWFGDGKKTPEYEAAWEHHWQSNDHHPEFWQGEDMDYLAILEMICDWGSFSLKSGDMHELKSFYYDKAKDDEEKMLSDETKKTIEYIIDKVEEVIAAQEDEKPEEEIEEELTEEPESNLKTFGVRFVNSVDRVSETTVKASSRDEARKLVKKNLGREVYRIIDVYEIKGDSRMNMYETWDELEKLNEEKEFRSEFARLMSTPEGREEFHALPPEKRSELIKADTEADPVQKILNDTPDFEFEYEGFERDWYEDRFDPNSWYGHYQVGGTDYYSDYTYSKDAGDVFEDLRDTIIDKYIDKVTDSELLAKYRELKKAWDESDDETEDAACEALEVFIAENLELLVDIFYDQLTEHYAEDAEEWAYEHLDPDD